MKKCLHCGSIEVQEIYEGHQIYYVCRTCKTKSPRVLEDDGRILVERTDQHYKHYSIAALIRKDGKYLLTKRRRYPFAYHLIAGHIERADKTPEHALRREIFEETANSPERVKLIFSGEFDYNCRAGADRHHFYLFECKVDGKLMPNDELDGFYFADEAELQKLSPMSDAAKILLKKVGVIHD